MAYIPESHKKYNLLPKFVETDREVIIYPSRKEGEIDLLLLPYDEFIAPYGDGLFEFHGYKNYSEYYAKLDDFITRFGTTEGKLNNLGERIVDFKKDVQKINVKENWSVLRCIVSTLDIDDLQLDNYYYMACSVEPLKCEGIINDEGLPVYDGDFLNTYWETERDNWEIIEDPTWIARLLFKDK